MKTLLIALGLKDTATEAEALSALTALQTRADGGSALERELVTLTGGKDRSDSLSAISALKKAAAEESAKVTALSAKVAQLEDAKLGSEVDSLVESAMREAKIAPAQAEFWKKQGRKDLAAFKDFLATAQPLVPIKPLEKPNTPPAQPGPAGEPTELELSYARQMGLSPEEFKKYRASTSGVRVHTGPAQQSDDVG